MDFGADARQRRLLRLDGHALRRPLDQGDVDLAIDLDAVKRGHGAGLLLQLGRSRAAPSESAARTASRVKGAAKGTGKGFIGAWALGEVIG